MSTAYFLSRSVERLAEAPPVLILVGRWTVLLALAWVAHAVLARSNPRWRVALWRSAVVGLAVIAGLMAAPPFLTWRLARIDRAAPPPVAEPPWIAGPPFVSNAQPPRPSRAPRISPEIRPRTVSPGPGSGGMIPHLDMPVGREIVSSRAVSSPPGTPPVSPVRPGTPAGRGGWLLAAWLAGVGVLSLRLALSARVLSRIVRRSSDAPDWVVEESRTVAARLGVGAVRVASSAEVPSPCLTGPWHPVLLLPERQCLFEERADLRAILAHELAHVRGRDLAWNALLHLASVVLWFHPLAWRSRVAHASACDAVCDSVAADLLDDVAGYGRALARLALRVAGPPPAHGLAMARSSDVRRRIESLQRKVHRSPLPWRLVMPAILSVSLVVMVIGGLGLATAEAVPAREVSAPKEGAAKEGPVKTAPEPETKSSPAQPGRLTVNVVDARTGEPLEGVEVAYRAYVAEKAKSGKPITGKDGVAVVEYDAKAKLGSFTLTVRKPGYVPAHVYLDGNRHPLSLPARKEFRLEPGTTIGGVVNDEAGRPIEGATVSITMPPTESDMANYVFHVGTPKTDARGRWKIDEAPADLGPLGIRVEHPGYRHGFGKPSRGLDGVTAVLTKGLTLKGSVVDAGGRPVKGARAVLGHDIWGSNAPEGKTDERGEFTLENCSPGPSIVTVQADGFAPQFQDVRVEDGGKTDAIAFRLEPASVIRVRVVDVGGKPVPEAHFAADTWRGHRSVMYRGKTDAEGRFDWKSAPKDAVQFDIFKSGYMRRRQHPIVASDAEEVVVLHPELTVSGRVTDAATGEPVPSFRIIRGMTFEGRDQVSWSRNEATEFTGGRFTETFDSPMKGWHLRVEAPGYKTADSRAFRSDEGRTTQDFALERAAGLGGIVLLPDGKPAAGAEVALATRGVYVSLRGAGFDRNYNFPVTKAGPDGQFTFPPPDDQYLLVAASDAGFADAPGDEFAKTGKLVLRPWGKLEGRVMVGKKPGANLHVSFQPKQPERGGASFFLNYGGETRADGDGRFVFDKVVPGPGSVSRVVVTEFVGGSQSHMPCWQEPVEVPPGGAASVTVGGRGRPVVGKVVVDGTPEPPIDWRQNNPAEIRLPRGKLGQGPRGWDRYASNLDKDGRFRIDDVPPGSYELTIPVNSPPDPRSCGAGTEIGRATLEFNVPEGAVDVPVDVGNVEAKLLPTLKVGDLAPDFTARRLDGGRLKLGDYQGKLVLLDFWATWCGPCLAEMPAMKDLQKTFGGDDRFALVGMSCDEAPEAPARYARENGLDWTQGFAGNLNGGVAASYLIRSIPATFLVGPDGRVLARNLRGPALKEAIGRALEDRERFSAAKSATRPPRFPVTRFELEGEDRAPAAATAAVVLDDCDADFGESRPHHDGLRFLGASGRELRTLKEFNTCQTVGGSHPVAVDTVRGRVYLCEAVTKRVTALDLSGRKLWQVNKIPADALAVDPRTGNLWCSGGGDLVNGETVVLDPDGKEVESFPVRGIDLAYDPKTDGFWLVGYGITKLSRAGEVLFHKPRDGWACVSVAVNPGDGSVWICERDHPDVARSVNRVWHLDAQGGVIGSESLGKKHPFAVACDPRTGTAYVVNLRSEILRFTHDGRELPAFPIAGVAIAVGPTSGQVWVTTKSDVLRLDESGAVLGRTPFGSDSGQSWLVAF